MQTISKLVLSRRLVHQLYLSNVLPPGKLGYVPGSEPH